jgi:hypothetical protein
VQLNLCSLEAYANALDCESVGSGNRRHQMGQRSSLTRWFLLFLRNNKQEFHQTEIQFVFWGLLLTSEGFVAKAKKNKFPFFRSRMVFPPHFDSKVDSSQRPFHKQASKALSKYPSTACSVHQRQPFITREIKRDTGVFITLESSRLDDSTCFDKDEASSRFCLFH